jgi:fatty acid desaturase
MPKIGMSEIILILIVVSVVILGIRLMGAGAAPKKDNSPERYQFEREQQRRYDEQVKAARRSRIQILGIVVILAGIALFAYSSAIMGLIKLVWLWPVGALVLVILGAFFIFSARRR